MLLLHIMRFIKFVTFVFISRSSLWHLLNFIIMQSLGYKTISTLNNLKTEFEHTHKNWRAREQDGAKRQKMKQNEQRHYRQSVRWFGYVLKIDTGSVRCNALLEIKISGNNCENFVSFSMPVSLMRASYVILQVISEKGFSKIKK